MKKVIIKRIGVGALVKWHAAYSLIAGVIVGLVYAIASYLYTGQNLSGYLFWYGLGMPLLYLVTGVGVSVMISFLFNTLSDSSGGLTVEVDVEAESDPPPPPSFTGEKT